MEMVLRRNVWRMMLCGQLPDQSTLHPQTRLNGLPGRIEGTTVDALSNPFKGPLRLVLLVSMWNCCQRRFALILWALPGPFLLKNF